tara:strand:- start:518 stop:874 length:357 start_codon:yes stop_codon:yes gene_type:complete
MKITTILSITSFAIGVCIGSQLPSVLVEGPVTISTFKINSSFNEWANRFDSKEVGQAHKEYGINPLFRGVNRKDPTHVVVIHKSNPGSFEKFLSNKEFIIYSSGHILNTTVTTDWSFD